MKHIYSYLIIAAVAFLVYYNSLSNEFVFDDESVIQTNASIQDLSNIPKFFTADEGFHKVIGRYYRPVVSTSYATDFYIWGMNPYGFHLTNVLIHVISCLLLYKIFIVLFWRYKFRNLISMFSTLIFAVHPIHTEAVTWISGRTDSMVTMFFFASFLFYLLFTRETEFSKKDNLLHTITEKNYLYLTLSILFYAAGLLTKEMIVTMPVIILLYDFVYRKKKMDYLKQNALTYILFIAVTLGYLVLRYMILSGIPERENYLYFIGKDYVVVLGTMLKTIPVYFRLLLAPFSLLYHYNGVIPDAKTIIETPVLLSILFLFVMLYLTVFFYKKDSVVAFCILFFFVSLLPVMNIIPTMNLMAERFLYLPSFALSLLICHLALVGSSKRDFSILAIGVVVIIMLLSYLTYVRNEDWKSNNTLYMSAKGIEGSVILVNEANIYANGKKYEDAAKLYKRAIELRDNNVLAHHNLGLVYLLNGKLDSAEMRIKRGIYVDSLAPDGYFQLATIYNMEGKKDEAIQMLEKLQTVYPDYKDSKNLLERIKSGETVEGNIMQEDFNMNDVVKNKITTLQNSSYKLYQEKNFEGAIKDLEELISLNKDPSVISGYLNNIAMCYSELKDETKEEKYFLDALTKDRKNVNAMNGLAAYYLKKNDINKAKEYLNRVLTVNPDDPNAKNKLDSLKSIK